MQNFNYGLAVEKHVLRSIEIIHYCLYENKPCPEDKKQLEEELRTDKEFGLTDFPKDNTLMFLKIREMTKEEIEDLKSSL